MRLALDPRARRLLRRVPHTTVYSVLELLLLSLLAIQAARLVWTIVTPVDPIGDWKASSALRPAMPVSRSLLEGFDPFFRLSGGNSPMVVTSLNLKLYGVREDRASGRGSAIVGTPDGQQRSFAVGEEIVPGVKLIAVGFDSVTIDRGGTPEQLFLDQSGAASVVAPAAPSASTTSPFMAAPPPPPGAPTAVGQFQFQPRSVGGRVTGFIVMPSGSGDAFRTAGFAPGDVIVAVNGQRITSAEQGRALASQIAASGATVEVDRGGRTVSLRLRGGQ
jgi:general secretion pathway protein C